MHHKHKRDHLPESQLVIINSVQSPPKEEPIQEHRQIKYYPELLVLLKDLDFVKCGVQPVVLQNIIKLWNDAIRNEQHHPGKPKVKVCGIKDKEHNGRHQ